MLHMRFSSTSGSGDVHLSFTFDRRRLAVSGAEIVRLHEASGYACDGAPLTAAGAQAAADHVLATVALPRRRGNTEWTLCAIAEALEAYTGLRGWYCSNRSRVMRRRRQSPLRDNYGYAPVQSQLDRDRTTIHEYSYKPRPDFRTAPSELTEAFYGVELEIDDPSEDLDRYTVPGHAAPLFYCKSDGSLTHGVELVSHPSSEGWWREKSQEVSTLLRNLSGLGWKSHNARTCGMHVHISRTAFATPLHLYRFLHLIYRQPEFTLAISQRAPERLRRWASLDVADRRALKAKAGLPGGWSSGERYEAVNITGRTVEVRFFNGTLRVARFMKNLEYCWAAVAYTHDETNLRRVSAKGFMAWLSARTAQYPNLAAFLEENGIATVPLVAEEVA